MRAETIHEIEENLHGTIQVHSTLMRLGSAHNVQNWLVDEQSQQHLWRDTFIRSVAISCVLSFLLGFGTTQS